MIIFHKVHGAFFSAPELPFAKLRNQGLWGRECDGERDEMLERDHEEILYSRNTKKRSFLLSSLGQNQGRNYTIKSYRLLIKSPPILLVIFTTNLTCGNFLSGPLSLATDF